jgi:hypothetical protein
MIENEQKRVIYTALIGDYEKFSSFNYEVRPNTKLVLFTDSNQLKSDEWSIIKVRPRFPSDSIRSARYLKIMGPSIFENIDQSLWIDNTVFLKTAPDIILDILLKSKDFMVPFHSFHRSVAAEFSAVQAAGYDDFARIYEQLFHYQNTHPHILSQKVLWTAILARRHTPMVKKTMEIWWEQILRYSRRDQLSINYALDETGVNAGAYNLDNHESIFHRWPVAIARKYGRTKANNVLDALMNAPISKLCESERLLSSMEVKLKNLSNK